MKIKRYIYIYEVKLNVNLKYYFGDFWVVGIIYIIMDF